VETRSGFASVDGAQIYYETIGSGPPVVFVHGFTLDTRMWDEQVGAFSERHQVIRYDVRGFGRSSAVGSASYSSVDDLKGLVDYLGLPPAAMIGLSMGGGIVTSFAVKYPAATRALVAVDSSLWGYQFSKEFDARFEAITRAARVIDVAAAKALWLADTFFAPANESPAVKEKLRQIVDDYSGWHWLNHDPERGMNPQTIERLSEIGVPTLVVLGKRDLPDFHQVARTLIEKIPGACQVTLAGAGHMANMEAPREFNRVVLEFLAKV
jgi:3-oxoadipate enol-lactonase